MLRPKAKLRLRKVCRGSFKIFALVECGIDCTELTLSARAITDDRNLVVPAITYRAHKTSFVLVLAVLTCSQHVTLTLKDREGTTICTATHVVNPKLAQLSSQAHTFLRDQKTESIRNYDSLAHDDHFIVQVDRMVREEFETYSNDIIQGEAMLFTEDEHLLSEPVSVCAIHREGHSVSEQEIICRDVVKTAKNGRRYRSVQFSMRVRWPVADFHIWVHAESGATDSLVLMDLEECTERRNWWRAWTMPVADDDRYPIYFRRFWAASDQELDDERANPPHGAPSFAVIVPVTGEDLLASDKSVESVLAQTYAAREVILATDGKPSQPVTDALERWCRRDACIRTCDAHSLGADGWPVTAAIAEATSDVVVCVGEGDQLAPDALYRYATEFAEDETCDVAYSDEDILNGTKHTRPFFKPTFEPDLVYALPYISHPLCARRSLFADVAPGQDGFNEAEIHYLALVAAHGARSVHRITRVLCHLPVSAHLDADDHVKAVQAFLDHAKERATATPSVYFKGGVSLRWEPEGTPKVSIIIPNKDNADVLERCLDSLLARTDYENFEVIICENNSTEDETFATYEKYCVQDARVGVCRFEGTFNYAAVNNFAAGFATGDFLVLLNNDTEIICGDWLRRMVGVCMRPSTGIVGAKLLYPDETVQHAGVIMRPAGVCHRDPYHPRNHSLYEIQLIQDVTAVTAACLMVKRDLYDKLGGLDESFAVDYNDVDFCWRVLRDGWRVVYDPGVELKHYESVSRGKHESPQAKKRFEHEKKLLRSRWPDHFDHIDPACNPNLDQLSAYVKLNASMLPDEDWQSLKED